MNSTGSEPPRRTSDEQLQVLLQNAARFVEFSASPLETGRLSGEVELRVIWPLAAAARCRRLVEGMLWLREGDLLDLIGVAARTHFECWAAGMYVLHGGEMAVQEVAGDFKHWLGGMIRQLEVQLPPVTPPWLKDASAERLPTGTLVSKLKARLVAEDHPAKDYPMPAYLRLFGGESLFSSHGRVGSWLPHIAGNADTKQMRIQLAVDGRPLALERIPEAAALAASLAVEALDATGSPPGADLIAAAASLGSPWYPPRPSIDAP